MAQAVAGGRVRGLLLDTSGTCAAPVSPWISRVCVEKMAYAYAQFFYETQKSGSGSGVSSCKEIKTGRLKSVVSGALCAGVTVVWRALALASRLHVHLLDWACVYGVCMLLCCVVFY